MQTFSTKRNLWTECYNWDNIFGIDVYITGGTVS